MGLKKHAVPDIPPEKVEKAVANMEQLCEIMHGAIGGGKFLLIVIEDSDLPQITSEGIMRVKQIGMGSNITNEDEAAEVLEQALATVRKTDSKDPSIQEHYRGFMDISKKLLRGDGV